jgi:hypothetical protein
MGYRERFIQAHKEYTKRKFPQYWAAGHYNLPNFPKVATANGLTKWVIDFLMWSGYRATRISSSGRYAKGQFIYGTTRKGTADVSATINGRSVMLEIKVGKDRPSKEQLKEQELERNAGGIYEFVKTPDEFLEIYDKLIS